MYVSKLILHSGNFLNFNSQNVLKIKVNWSYAVVCTMKLTNLPRLWIISQNKHNLLNSY